jgi:hypothetical protein
VRLAVIGTCILFMSCASHRGGLTVPALESLPSAPTTEQLISLVEAEGDQYPRIERSSSVNAFDHGEWRGSSDRRCVDVTWVQPARSGEFVIGGQIGDGHLVHGRENKIWWAPLHNSLDMTPLLVRGVRVEPKGDSIRWENSRVGFPVPPRGEPKDTISRYFFPSWLTPPSAGTWLVVPTSGENWGCFILHVE